MNKPTVVIGASDNPSRYSFIATNRLREHGHTVFPVVIRPVQIHCLDIITGKPQLSDVNTVTLYVGPQNQSAWADYILSLHPQRVIFNPGTENPEMMQTFSQNNIQCVEACTLVMLSIGNY